RRHETSISFGPSRATHTFAPHLAASGCIETLLALQPSCAVHDDPDPARREPDQRKQDHAMPDTPDRILRLKAVLDRTGLCRSTLYRKMDGGTFPKNVQISSRCVGWRESAVEAWMRNPMFYEAADHEQM